MNIQLDKQVVDKLVGKRVTEFNKKIRGLEVKLSTRDNKIHKLKREIEILKGDIIDQESGACKDIASLSSCLVTLLKKHGWVPENYCPDCDNSWED